MIYGAAVITNYDIEAANDSDVVTSSIERYFFLRDGVDIRHRRAGDIHADASGERRRYLFHLLPAGSSHRRRGHGDRYQAVAKIPVDDF